MLNPDLFLNPNLFNEDVEQKPTRDGFGDALLELGEKNPNVVVLTADLSESTRTDKFEKKYPDRFFECGVAEQNMAAVAAGLGVSGKIPFISSYATFSPGKNWETIRTTIIYNNSNVKIAGHHSGVITGPDGATHQATEDIAITRAWPGICVIVPCDAIEAKKATITSADIKGPVYLRFTRDKTPLITTEQTPFSEKILPFWNGQNPSVLILGTGHMLFYALLAAKNLESEGIGVIVGNVSTIKPLDKEGLLSLAKKVKGVVTVEDHQVAGGLGGAISEFLSENHPLPMKFIGLQDTFAESGTAKELIAKYGMDQVAIAGKVKELINQNG